MTDPSHRNAFGGLVVDPRTLARADRVDELRRVAGRLQAASDPGSKWLGATLLDWLHRGGRFDDALEVRPERGSHRTVAGVLRQARQDQALLRLAVAVGCDRRALRILRGGDCSGEHRDLRDAALALKVPTGPHAISRARRRDRSAAMT